MCYRCPYCTLKKGSNAKDKDGVDVAPIGFDCMTSGLADKRLGMNEIRDPRWEKLKDFRVGSNESELSFIDRLARENWWTKTYAERVFGEYLRFVYLAALGPNQVTPSDQVDQVWHLHLCYSDSYWRELCGEILEKQLHHGPTKGGHAEGERFEGQYDYTLARYEEVFGELPPNDVWPPVGARFDPEQKFVRVDLSRAWVIGKRTASGLVGLLIMVWFVTSGEEYLERWGVSEAEFVGLIFGALFLFYMFSGKSRRRRRRRNRKSGGAGCSGGCGTSGCSSGCGGGCGGCGS